jgi:hypothetical protein
LIHCRDDRDESRNQPLNESISRCQFFILKSPVSVVVCRRNVLPEVRQTERGRGDVLLRLWGSDPAAVGAGGAAVSPAQLPQIPIPQEPRRMAGFAKVCIAAVVLISGGVFFSTPVPTNISTPGAYHTGETLGFLLIPFLIAYVAAGRKKARRPNLFAGLFCGLSVVLGGLWLLGTAANALVPTETTDARIGRLMREADGKQPVKDYPGGYGQLDTVLRDFFRSAQQRDRDYRAEVQNLDESEMRRLYSGMSFSSPQEIQRVMQQLQQVLDVDLKQEQAVREMVNTTEGRIRGLDVAEKDKQDVIAGMERTLAPIYSARAELISAEKDWIESTEALYQFGYEQENEIQIRGNEIFIANPYVRQEFNNRWRASRQAEQSFSTRQKQFQARMRELQSAK